MLDDGDTGADEANEAPDGDEASDFNATDFVLDEWENVDQPHYRVWHDQIAEEVEFVLDQVQYRFAWPAELDPFRRANDRSIDQDGMFKHGVEKLFIAHAGLCQPQCFGGRFADPQS